MQEATPIVDDNLSEVVTLATKSCRVTTQLNIDKDIDIMRKVTSLPITASLHESPNPSHHLVEGPTSLEVAAGRLSSVDSPIAILGVTGGKSAPFIALLATSFCPGLDTQSITTAAI